MPTTDGRWRRTTMCGNCPFAPKGKGALLRATLRPGRMTEIIQSLLRGEHFVCHQTTKETGDGTELLCAGACAFQEQHGVISQYQQVCERLDMLHGRRTVTFTRHTTDDDLGRCLFTAEWVQNDQPKAQVFRAVLAEYVAQWKGKGWQVRQKTDLKPTGATP